MIGIQSSIAQQVSSIKNSENFAISTQIHLDQIDWI